LLPIYRVVKIKYYYLNFGAPVQTGGK